MFVSIHENGDRIFYRVDLLEGGYIMKKRWTVKYTRLPDTVEVDKE